MKPSSDMQRVYTSSFIVLVLLQFCLTSRSFAGSAPSVDEIVRETEHMAYYLGKDGRARVTMIIKDSQDRERKRRFVILRRDALSEQAEQDVPAGDQKYFVHINYPSDIKNTVLLVWKHPDSDDDRWLYLPALDLARRIAAGDRRTSFLGSDFLYEDISGRSLNEDTHELLETTTDYYVVKNIPRQPNTVEFSEYTLWIHRKTFLPVKVEYRDKQGKKYRVYTALKVETIQGHPTIVKSRMRNLILKQETTLEFNSIQYDTDLPEEVFSERYLRNPPRDLLR